MKEEIRKIEALTDEITAKYDLTKQQALERLKKAGVSDSESDQMLLVWCRKGLIDAVRVSRGLVSERGIRVSSVSLEAFITSKKGDVERILEELYLERKRNEILREELKRANAKLKKFEEDGYVLKEEQVKKIKVSDVEPVMNEGKIQLHFRYDRSKHIAEFDDCNLLINLQKRTRKGFVNVTDISNNLRDALEELYKEHSKHK